MVWEFVAAGRSWMVRGIWGYPSGVSRISSRDMVGASLYPGISVPLKPAL